VGTAQVAFAFDFWGLWHHRKSWTGTGYEREIISAFFSGTPLDSRYEKWNFESNQLSAFWYLNPTNRNPSCFEFKTNQSYAFDLNPTNGMPSLNGQSSTFRCTFIYLKSHFTSWFQAVRTSFAFKIVYIISKFVYCVSDSQT
jgi:hypothetical protein